MDNTFILFRTFLSGVVSELIEQVAYTKQKQYQYYNFQCKVHNLKIKNHI